MKKHNVTTARMLALLACAMLLLGVAAGCTSANTGGGSTVPAEKKAMTEAIAKWYAAQGALDVPGFKAGIYDPEDTLGVASMTTAPPDAKKSDVKWAWVGDKVVVSIASNQSTVTLSPSKTATNVVDVTDSTGSSGTFVMINKDGVWKIDVAATQRAAAAAEASASVPATGKP